MPALPQPKLDLEAANRALGAAAERIGTADFYDALLSAVSALVPHESATAVRYSTAGTPIFLLHQGFSDDLAREYEQSYFVVDPFYRYWRTTEQPGVVALSMFPSAAIRRSRYFREFLRVSQIEDELGLFLPPIGRASVALFLERSVGMFLPEEKARLENFYPVIAGLDVAHVNCTIGADGPNGTGRSGFYHPVLLLDRDGTTVHANQSWRSLAAEDPELGEAVAQMILRDESEMVLCRGGVLQRTPVDASHPMAGSGWLFIVERQPMVATEYDQDIIAGLSPRLTPRERDIVRLILAGYPTNTIAARLDLQRGTVKNHRLKIYQKLDITTERELFLAYITVLQQSRHIGTARAAGS